MGEMHYFYRCRRCFGLITRLQMQAAMSKSAEVCSCGSGTVAPTNPTGTEWVKPAVLKMIVLKLLGRLAPAPPPTMPIPVPIGVQGVPALAAEEILPEDDVDDSTFGPRHA